MNSWKVLAAYCIASLTIASMTVSSAQATPFIGPTEEVDAEIVEYAGVDSSKPGTPSSNLTVHGDSISRYAFVKMSFSKLPPIENIFIVSAYLSFHINYWSGAGSMGYASVASHYSDDDSWTEDTLTWNNKPEFDTHSTDTWGFSFFSMADELEFMIEEDVVKTLESGDTLLTEVITWGSGTGGTSLSGPELKIVYATRPVYKLRLDAVCDAPDVNITKTDLIRIGVANQIFGYDGASRLPNLEHASPGTYDLGFQGRCKFSGWQTNGGVSVSNPGQPQTRLTIDSDGELTAKCSLDWVIYGDEDSGTRFAFDEPFNSSESYAEKYSPLVSGYLRLVRVYVMEDPVPFELRILGMTDDPTKKAPTDMAPAVTIEPTSKGWVEVDLSSQKILVERDHTYYISITWLTDNKPVFARGTRISGLARYAFRNNSWETFYSDVLIQHIVSRTLEETVSFPKISASTTTTSFLFEVAIGAATLMLVIGAIGFGAYRVTRRRKPATVPSGTQLAARYRTGPAGVKYCVQCGELIPEVAVYCPRCASKQE